MAGKSRKPLKMSPVGRKLRALVPFPTNGPWLCPTPVLHGLASARVPRQRPGRTGASRGVPAAANLAPSGAGRILPPARSRLRRTPPTLLHTRPTWTCSRPLPLQHRVREPWARRWSFGSRSRAPRTSRLVLPASRQHAFRTRCTGQRHGLSGDSRCRPSGNPPPGAHATWTTGREYGRTARL